MTRAPVFRTSLASGTVATRARSAARSCSSSARASSRATCSPAISVTGPAARRNAWATGYGSPISLFKKLAAVAQFDRRLLNILGQQQHRGAARLRRRDRLWQCRHDVGRIHHPPAVHRHHGKQCLAVQRAVAAAGVLKSASAVETGRRLADQRKHRHAAGQRLPKPGHCVQTSAPGCRAHHAQPGTTAAITISHRRCRKLMLSQDRGEIRTEIRSVIKILDIRTVHAEDVINADRRKVLDNVVNHPVSPGYGLHAVTAEAACLDVSAMVPRTRCAITPYMEPPSASKLVVATATIWEWTDSVANMGFAPTIR